MDFNFINLLIRELDDTNIFKYTFVGFKMLAFGIITLKFIDKFIKSIGKEDLPIGEFLSLLGVMLLIGSSDFLISSIEQVFNGVQKEISVTDSGNIEQVISELQNKRKTMFKEADQWYDYLTLFIEDSFTIFTNAILLIVVMILKIVDLSVTVSYLLLRVFYLQLLKFVFPIVLALSTLDVNLNFLQSWIKRYIGIYLLGIAYIGIMSFTTLIIKTLSFELTWDILPLTSDGLGMLVVAIVVINMKIKLFSNVTSYTTGMFQ